MQAAADTAISSHHAAPGHLNLIVAQRAQAIIDVAVAGSRERFQSAIVGVDASAQTIAIDELFPKGAAAAPGQKVVVTLRLDGERRDSFSTEVIRPHSDGGYLLRLPATVDYHQRRAAYRVAVPANWTRGSEFFSPGSSRCAATVRDISPAGIRLEIDGGSSALQRGDTLEELYFELLGQRYECRASVRNIRVKGTTAIEIGAAFLDLPRPQQRTLERSLMQMQRRQAASAAQSRAAG